MAFDRRDEATDGPRVDTLGLQQIVMAALERHFSGYGEAAAAQSSFRQVRASIQDDDCLTLFGADEAMRAGLTANPQALKWSAFEREAAGQIAPYRFSIRFTE